MVFGCFALSLVFAKRNNEPLFPGWTYGHEVSLPLVTELFLLTTFLTPNMGGGGEGGEFPTPASSSQTNNSVQTHPRVSADDRG